MRVPVSIRSEKEKMRRSKLFKTLVCAVATVTAGSISPSASASPMPMAPGDFLIYQVGDGVSGLTTNATPVSIVEYTPAGSLVQTIPLASSGASALTAVGTGSTEGILQFSADGKYLTFTGYRKDAGGLSPAGDASTTTARVVARMDPNGIVDLTTALGDAFGAQPIRGATSPDGTSFYISGGANGPRYVSSLGASTSTQLDTKNGRQISIVSGNLVLAISAGTTRGLGTYSGLPVSGLISPSGISPTVGSSGTPQSFFYADVDPNTPGMDTVYLLDSAATLLDKFSLIGGNWTAEGSVSSNAFDLTGKVAGNGVVTLYLTNGSSLQSYTDSTGFGGALTSTSFTTLATAPTNTAFRGIAEFPQLPEPGAALSVLMLAPFLARQRRTRSRRPQ